MKVYDKELKMVISINEEKFDKEKHLTQEQYEQELKKVLDNEEEFKQALIKIENKINDFIKNFNKNKEFLINKYGGKIIKEEEIEKLIKQYPLNISNYYTAEIIDEIDIRKSINKVIEALNEIKEKFNPNKHLIYISDIYLCEHIECYGDNDYYLTIHAQINCHNINSSVPMHVISKTKEKEISKLFPVKILFDCSVFKDYLEEDLTKKGLFKRINLFNQNNC